MRCAFANVNGVENHAAEYFHLLPEIALDFPHYWSYGIRIMQIRQIGRFNP
jgi:hypothetical protein